MDLIEIIERYLSIVEKKVTTWSVHTTSQHFITYRIEVIETLKHAYVNINSLYILFSKVKVVDWKVKIKHHRSLVIIYRTLEFILWLGFIHLIVNEIVRSNIAVPLTITK